MIFVPLSTDAPVYYYPYGTIGLMVVNVLAFVATQGGSEEFIIQYGLSHGEGLHPVQWVTSNFIHYGFFHLIGNLLFLWGFGLVVEGKIGPWLYVPLYMGIGVVECAIEQMAYAAPGPPSFGASAILFGLMAIALTWAPSNEVTVFFFFWFFMYFRTGTFEMSIFWFSVLTLLWQMLCMVLMGFDQLSSEIMHMMGAFIGGTVGFSMLLSKTVDCEGWDLISVLRGQTPNSTRFTQREGARSYGQRKLKRKLKKSRDQIPDHLTAPQPVAKPAKADRFVQLVTADKPQAAFAEYQQLRCQNPEWRPDPQQLRTLAKALRQRRRFEDSLTVNLDYLKATEFKNPNAIFDAADILVLIHSRPQAALKLMNRVQAAQLSDEQQQRRRKIEREAQKAIDQGVLETEFEL